MGWALQARAQAQAQAQQLWQQIKKIGFRLIVLGTCTVFILCVQILDTTAIASAQSSSSPNSTSNSSCQSFDSETLSVHNEWENHFPFDLIAGTLPTGTDITDTANCPTIPIWDNTYTLCSIPMIGRTVVHVFGLRLLIQTIMSI